MELCAGYGISRPTGESTWAVHDSFHPLGTLDERTLTITSPGSGINRKPRRRCQPCVRFIL